MPAFTAKQISLQLKAVPCWSKRAHTIHRTFKFEGFVKAIDFVKRTARKAQKLNHHPDIDIRFDKVTLKLTTHDEGGSPKKISLLPASATRSSPSVSGREQR
jgi:4a-hydroxytetrahydrobiopterin dehydratase